MNKKEEDSPRVATATNNEAMPTTSNNAPSTKSSSTTTIPQITTNVNKKEPSESSCRRTTIVRDGSYQRPHTRMQKMRPGCLTAKAPLLPR